MIELVPLRQGAGRGRSHQLRERGVVRRPRGEAVQVDIRLTLG